MANKRLELTWIGKGEDPAVEPRILLHDPSKDYGDPSTENMLIHGDNLLVLKALEQQYAGQVKCVYIDPPFNTGQIFADYDDNLEMSTWLNLMYSRLKLLHSLLSESGTLFVHIDDGYLPYLTIMCDEIFGRDNRLYLITFKQGAATGHKAINPGCVTTTNFILMYAKSKYNWAPNRVFTKRGRDDRYSKFITNIDENYSDWNIVPLIEAFANEIGQSIPAARKVAKETSLLEEFVIKNGPSVIRTARPDTKSVGKDVQEVVADSKHNPDRIFFLHREGNPDMYFINGERILFYQNKLKQIDGEWVSAEPLTTLWDDILSNNLHKEGGVSFPKGKKPEHLIKRVLEIATSPGDLVLDSFLGSGTTAAVAHKMGRRYIGVEMGEQIYTHCKPRMDMLIDDKDESGITKAVNWQGGGGYKFYELAPTLIVKDKYGNPVFSEKYSPEMLVAAVAKINGYHYAPDSETFWKQGFCQDNSFIYVTTQYLTGEVLDGIAAEVGAFENLLICAPAFDTGLNKRYENITVRKIPQSVLNKCQYGVDNYNLNIIDPPALDEEEWEDD